MLGHSAWNVEKNLGKKIYGHNLIRLHHADTGSFLFAGPSFEGVAPEVVLKRYADKKEEELLSVGRSHEINSIWEITHFCKLSQGVEFRSGQGFQGQNRILLRHFNSGKILAAGANNLPYLQDFRETVRAEASRSGLFRRETTEERSPRQRAEMSPRFDVEASERSALQGYSAGASRSRSASGSDGGSGRDGNRGQQEGGRDGHGDGGGRDSRGGDEADGSPRDSQKRDEELFDFKVDDSFAHNHPEEEEGSDKINDEFSVKVPDERGDNVLNRGQSNEISIGQIEEPSLSPNDPPIIKKPFGTIFSLVKRPINKMTIEDLPDDSAKKDKDIPLDSSSRKLVGNTSINDLIKREGHKLHVGVSDRTLLAPSLDSREINTPQNKLQNAFKKEGAASRIKKSVSKLFDLNRSMARPGDNVSGASGNLKRLDINNLLPHKEALRDLRHSVHFTQFQGAEAGVVADGESFKIMKHNLNSDEPSHLYLDVLDSQFDLDTVRRAHEVVRGHPSTAAQVNKFFKPLEDKQEDDAYLVGSDY